MQSAYGISIGISGEGMKARIPIELLSPAEMGEADRIAISHGPFDGYALMRNAGAAVAAEVLRRFPGEKRINVLCGPGNNGGDGYVVARLLREAGCAVRVFAEGPPREGTDAASAARDCPLEAGPLSAFEPDAGSLVVDALYGAGLTRSLDGEAARLAAACRKARARVVAVDLPSGISGDSGRAVGEAFEAMLTVTFFRLKPGHLLEPGRASCGEIVVVDIGLPETVLEQIAPRTLVNLPALWLATYPRPTRQQYKYSRGHVAVFSGGPGSTGAARLSALAAARSGAGAVTVYSPGNALAVNAAHLTSIMLRRVNDPDAIREALAVRSPDAFVLGPGFGLDRPVSEWALAMLEAPAGGTLVLDADGITSFRDRPEALYEAAKSSPLDLILTPHEGEFARLFPDLAADDGLSKLEKARGAAARSGAVVIFKGPDTVIASADGRAAVNVNGTPWLATAGSGDVLAGIVAGLAAQKMPAFDAACAAVWMHAEAGSRFGPGLIAEDLPGLMPQVLREILSVDPSL
jgi:hydroxyethylthiazole kinase-like uncharacterized protein yjeF